MTRRRVSPLLRSVRQSVRELRLGPEHAGLVKLAETLADTIDGMDAETRARMLAQTSGQLARVLENLIAAPRQPRAPAAGVPDALTTLRLRAAARGLRLTEQVPQERVASR
jgi:hypothetical protein